MKDQRHCKKIISKLRIFGYAFDSPESQKLRKIKIIKLMETGETMFTAISPMLRDNKRLFLEFSDKKIILYEIEDSDKNTKTFICEIHNHFDDILQTIEKIGNHYKNYFYTKEEHNQIVEKILDKSHKEYFSRNIEAFEKLYESYPLRCYTENSLYFGASVFSFKLQILGASIRKQYLFYKSYRREYHDWDRRYDNPIELGTVNCYKGNCYKNMIIKNYTEPFFDEQHAIDFNKTFEDIKDYEIRSIKRAQLKVKVASR